MYKFSVSENEYWSTSVKLVIYIWSTLRRFNQRWTVELIFDIGVFTGGIGERRTSESLKFGQIFERTPLSLNRQKLCDALFYKGKRLYSGAIWSMVITNRPFIFGLGLAFSAKILMWRMAQCVLLFSLHFAPFRHPYHVVLRHKLLCSKSQSISPIYASPIIKFLRMIHRWVL